MNSNYQNTFEAIKENLYTALVLRGPNWSLPFHISIDAPDTKIGVSLGQKEDIKVYFIYVISKNLTSGKLNYIVIEKYILVICM